MLSAENKLLLLLLNYLTHQMVLGGSEIDQSTMTSLKVLGPLDLSKIHSLYVNSGFSISVGIVYWHLNNDKTIN